MVFLCKIEGMHGSDRKRIAILADYPYWQYIQGCDRQGRHPTPWLAALVQAFSRTPGVASPFDKYEFHWIVLTKAVKKERSEEVNGQFMHLIPSGSKTVSQYLRYWPDRLKIRKFLKRLKPDLLHAWGTESAYGLCAKDFKGKKLFSLQGALTAYAQRAYMAPFMVRQARFEKEVFSAMPIITAESSWARDCVLELVPTADVRLWEYAAEERFFGMERRMAEHPLCVMAGTDTPIKNLRLAISAFSRPELKHVTLYLAGARPESYPNLPENIKPLGFVSRDRMVELHRASWALVHPSLADCCPNVVKEARTMGVPCVVTSECGAKQYIEHGKSGYIIEPHDEQQLVDAVLSMTKDAQTSIDMGQHDRERCREALSQKTMIDGILALYSEILQD